MSLIRSFLFCPGNNPRRVEKALLSGADAVILDLEDAVASSEKPATRAFVAEALGRPRRCAGFVRVNALSSPFARDDLAAVVAKGVDGILLPKLESIEELVIADALITGHEAARGLPKGSIELVPMIETARALVGIEAIAVAAKKTGRVQRMTFGAADLVHSLGMSVSLDEAELDYVRQRLVIATRGAGLDAPIDTVWFHLKEADAFRTLCNKSRRLGFSGKLCIHPDQVAIANEAFSPSDAEIAQAERIVAAFRAAEAQGIAAIQVDGQFVDNPVVFRAQRILELVAAISARQAPG